MHGHGFVELFQRQIETVLRSRRGEQLGEFLGHMTDLDAVLRALGACQTWRDRAQIEFDDMRVVDLARLGHTEQALRLEVFLEGFDLGLGAARALEVIHGLLIDREETHGRAVFGRHVADGGTVRHGQTARAFTEEFDELADHFFLAQDFGHGEHHVGRGHAFTHLAGQLEADHIRREEVHRLAEHRGLGLDAAHTPGDDAHAIDHGGVAVGADQRVGVVHILLGLVHAAREVLQIHLVDDAEARRHDAERVERLHAPLHELVALLVALKFQLHVQVERVLAAVVVDHDRVVDHQIDGHQRLDGLGLLAERCGSAAHGSQIGQQRHAGEVLQHDTRNDEGNLVGALGVRLPVGKLLHMLGHHLLAVAIAQHRFEHDAQRHRQAVHIRELLGERGE